MLAIIKFLVYMQLKLTHQIASMFSQSLMQIFFWQAFEPFGFKLDRSRDWLIVIVENGETGC